MIAGHLSHVRTILCLGAHADDIEIGCGGTILRLLDELPEAQVFWVVFGASEERQKEARASAEVFLAKAAEKTVVVKDFRDGFYPYQAEEIKAFFRELARQVSPDLIFTHRRDDAHQDHRLLADLSWCEFRNHLIMEYEIPKYEGDLGQPNVFFTVDQATCQRKVDGIMNAFPSQRAKPWFTDDTFWSLMRLRGIESVSPTKFAEGFYCRKFVV
jgi:LmbE family N-acetylglucosaminyl deacetylase